MKLSLIVNTLCVLLGLLLAAVLGAGAGNNHLHVKTCDDFASLTPLELEGMVYFDSTSIICETPLVSPLWAACLCVHTTFNLDQIRRVV